ncbi:hypothetical protein CQA49_04700 [Helicobacter sp. MIT 00-7814]|uniref:alpha-1,2-fucosyltransferase n=1 Tax=unclassified Helicobacter TaxID=2593540 RepID=UPI000E1F0696|nr:MULTISPECIES: alpha-1,2-fucosyltransferase [unclassified Helicobacter]RDU54607.1 hypothetical protein CQA49_04700 [Helicobacter sp. MIT 00-7814]RDU54666.1 hypothetical protein CQA37_05185 [Helicobacter sp. MIT 99-10781]
MKIVKIMGGLGNQMFQYAFARALQEKFQCEVLLDTSFYTPEIEDGEFPRPFLLQNYNITLKTATPKDVKYCTLKGSLVPKPLRKYFREYIRENEDGARIYDENLLRQTKKNTFYEGYFQNAKYFAPLLGDLRKELTLKNALDSINMGILAQIKSCNAVSVHIRRGDYIALGCALCDMDYYKRAIGYINERVENPCYFLFSDDSAWLRENARELGGERFFIMDHNPQEKAHYDLELMRACKHNIIANSTFSLWGGALNENPQKIIIAPKGWGGGFDVKII